MSRNAFTSREIEYLVMYIAKYNPVPAGRLGNNLYKSLVDNDKRRPWAKGHSWQSWREYYKKNQDEMDRKIRKYQKEEEKKAREAEEPPQPTSTNPAKEESEKSEAPKPPPKVSNMNQNRNGQAGSSGQNAATKNTARTENAQQVTSARVEAPREKARVDPERMERGGSWSRLPEVAMGRESWANVSNSNRGNKKYAAEDTALKELPVKAEQRTPSGELAPVINTLVEVVDMSGDTESDNDLMRELFGSYKEDEDTQEIDELQDSSQAHPPAPTKAVRSKVKKRAVKEPPVPPPTEPSVQVLSQEPTPPKSGAEAQPEAVVLDSPACPSPLRKPKPTRKLRKPVDEDPFETPTSTPSPPARPQQMLGMRGTLPVLVDDGFRTTLKRPRRSSTTGNEDAPVWPPKRAKRDSHNVQGEDMDIDEFEPEKARAVALPAARIYAPAPQIQGSVGPRPVQVNAVASSSTSRPPPLYSKSSTNIQQKRETVVVETSPPGRPSPDQARKSISHNAPAMRKVPQPTKLAAPPAAAIVNPISRTSSTFTLPAGALSDNDPFIGRISDKTKGKARASTILNNKPPPRIDLQKQLQRRLTATSASLSASRSGRSSLAPSTSSARHSREKEADHQSPAQWNTLTDDPKFRDADFLEAARQATVRGLAQIAATRGLELEQVRSIFMAAGNLEDTDFVLQQLHARRLQGRASAAAGRATPNDGGSVSSEEIPAGLVLRTATIPSAATERSRESTHRRRANKTRRSGRPSLVIRPLPPADDEYDLSEYSPPNKSRAGQFARLERQGRLEEALEREKRRVSGIHVEQTQLPLRQASPVLTASDGSPSPKSHREEEHMEVDASPHGSEDEHVQADEQDGVDGLDDVGVHEDVEEPDYVDVYEDVEEPDNVEAHEDVNEQDDADQQVDLDRQDESDGQYSSYDEDEVAQQDDIEERIVADELSDAAALSDAEEDDVVDVESVAQDEQEDDDDDDMYMPEQGSNHEADDESEERQEEDDGAPGSSPPYPTARTLMKRLSGDRENEPDFIAEMQEHRRLALSVTKENVDEMRAFEASHNPDLLKLWSIKWTRELMAIGRPSQKTVAGSDT